MIALDTFYESLKESIEKSHMGPIVCSYCTWYALVTVYIYATQ